MAQHRTTMRKARQKAGLSQQALADRLGVHQPTVAQWEAGRVMPRVDTAIRLAAALETSVEEIWPPESNRSDSKVSLVRSRW